MNREKIISEVNSTNKVDLSSHEEVSGLFEWFNFCDFPSGFGLVDDNDVNLVDVSKYDMPEIMFKDCSFEEDYLFDFKLYSKDGKS